MPKNWKDILILDWRGSRLKNLYFDTPDAEWIFFEYNADGIRIEKTYAERAGEVPVYTDVYTVNGSKILSEQRTDEETGNVIRTIYYVYDANGQPVGMKYNGVQYWYQKNMQGDVVRILNASGAEVVSYAYDAWGKVLSVSGSLSSTVGAANPFRYRGYYYDTETGWYYLNSRYYDPNVGRFLSPDVPDTLAIDFENFAQYNLYAYCFNNPVNMYDDMGYWPNWLKKAVSAVAVVVAVTVVAAVTVATAGAGTAAAVVAVGAAKGAAIGMASGAAMGAATGAVSHRVSTGSWKGSGQAALEGMGDGALSGAISGAVSGAVGSAAKVSQAAKAWDSSSKGGPIKNMSDHYSRHVIKEGKKAMTKNVITYTNDAKALWNSSNNVRILKGNSIFVKGNGVRGFYSPSGMVRSFMYQ